MRLASKDYVWPKKSGDTTWWMMTSSTTTCNIQGMHSWHVCRGVPSSIHRSGLGMWIYKYWLVVWTSLKNMSSSVGMMTFPIWWENHKNVPKHQPEYIEPRHINHRRALLVTPTDFACDSSAHHVLRLVQQRNLTETARQMPQTSDGFPNCRDHYLLCHNHHDYQRLPAILMLPICKSGLKQLQPIAAVENFAEPLYKWRELSVDPIRVVACNLNEWPGAIGSSRGGASSQGIPI